MRVLAGLALLSLLLAGCISAPDAPVGPAAEGSGSTAAMEAVRILMADVPCEAEVGAGTSDNILELARLQFGEEAGAHGEVDIKNGLALVARYQMGGFEVVDVSDPANLTLVSSFSIPETSGLDVKWTPDGAAALVGSYGQVHLVDLADPAQPVLRTTFHYKGNATPAQAHMLTPYEAEDGTQYVYVATQVGRQPLLVLQREGWNLTLAGKYEFTPVLASDAALGQHDMTVYHDEILDKPVLFIAEGTLGWSAADISDPAKPVRIGGWLSPEPGAGYTHTVRVQFLEGKRIVVTMSEVGVNTLKIYDATNLQLPVLLARWNADATRPHIPQHNLQLLDGMLYMAHYTEGVYVFNITSVMQGPPVVGTLAMEPVARYAVSEPKPGGTLGFANIWDVVLYEGILYVNDMTQGFSSAGFGCVVPGDEAVTATH